MHVSRAVCMNGCVWFVCAHCKVFLSIFKDARSSLLLLFLMTWPSQQFADVFTCYTIKIRFPPKTPLLVCACASIFAEFLNRALPVDLFAVLVQGPSVSVYCSLQVLRQSPVQAEANVPDHIMSHVDPPPQTEGLKEL